MQAHLNELQAFDLCHRSLRGTILKAKTSNRAEAMHLETLDIELQAHGKGLQHAIARCESVLGEIAGGAEVGAASRPLLATHSKAGFPVHGDYDDDDGVGVGGSAHRPTPPDHPPPTDDGWVGKGKGGGGGGKRGGKGKGKKGKGMRGKGMGNRFMQSMMMGPMQHMMADMRSELAAMQNAL